MQYLGVLYSILLLHCCALSKGFMWPHVSACKIQQWLFANTFCTRILPAFRRRLQTLHVAREKKSVPLHGSASCVSASKLYLPLCNKYSSEHALRENRHYGNDYDAFRCSSAPRRGCFPFCAAGLAEQPPGLGSAQQPCSSEHRSDTSSFIAGVLFAAHRL